jgi:hypothetical protein
VTRVREGDGPTIRTAGHFGTFELGPEREEWHHVTRPTPKNPIPSPLVKRKDNA